MLKTCDIDKQRIHIISHDIVRNMEKAVDDTEYQAWAASHLLTQGRW